MSSRSPTLKEMNASVALRELRAVNPRFTNQEATDHLKAKGLIITTSESIRDWENDQARRLIEKDRARCRRRGDVQQEFINIREVVEGESGRAVERNYWCLFSDLTAAEGALLVAEWTSRVKGASKQLYRYHDALTEKHGSEYQASLFVELPPRGCGG